MATTPFSDELITDLEGTCSWLFYGELGAIFQPRELCCTDPNTMGIVDGKTPVAVIEFSENPTVQDTSIVFDGSSSYDPDGSIVAYSWTMEIFSDPQLTTSIQSSQSMGTLSSGTFTAGTIGYHEFRLVVTDGTSVKSTPARSILIVEDPGMEAFIASAGSGGLFYTDDAAQTVSAKNGSLTNTAAYDIVQDPATFGLPLANRTLWRAALPDTSGGVLVSNDGGSAWVTKRPSSVSNDWSDGTAPTVSSDLTFIKLQFAASGRLFALARWQNASNEWRSALFYTDNAADIRADTSATVTWTQVSTGWSN